MALSFHERNTIAGQTCDVFLCEQVTVLSRQTLQSFCQLTDVIIQFLGTLHGALALTVSQIAESLNSIKVSYASFTLLSA